MTWGVVGDKGCSGAFWRKNSPSVPKRVYKEAVPTSDRCCSGIQELMGLAGQNELCGSGDVEWDGAPFPLLRAP